MKNEKCLDAGFICQVTLPSGKFIFLSLISPATRKVRELGWPNAMVQYITDNCHSDLNRAIYLGKEVRINGSPISELANQMATVEEYEEIILKLK